MTALADTPRGLSLLLRYSAFAVIATLANLAGQRLVLALGESHAFFLAAMVFGTAAGLFVKYLLDRRWIFNDAPRSLEAQGRQFGLYSAMGLVTTAIFWLMESAFWLATESHGWREIGALLGLAIGYIVKYQLDKRFVFTSAPEAAR